MALEIGVADVNWMRVRFNEEHAFRGRF